MRPVLVGILALGAAMVGIGCASILGIEDHQRDFGDSGIDATQMDMGVDSDALPDVTASDDRSPDVTPDGSDMDVASDVTPDAPPDAPDADAVSDADAPNVACTPQLTALEPSVANTADTVTLEGTFCGSVTVTFPGGATASATVLGAHRATVTVPAAATAGTLSATIGSTSFGSLAFRRASFGLGLQPFEQFDDQTNGARQMPALVTARNSFATVVAGGRVYVMGGNNASGGLSTVESAPIRGDGSLGLFQAASVQLTAPRYYDRGVVIGGYVYLISGCTTNDVRMPSVERAAIQSDGSLGSFGIVSGVTLIKARCNASVEVIGNLLYVIGGNNASGADEASVEAAPINADGSLGSFADTGLTLVTPRDALSTIVLGSYLYVVGGYLAATRAPTASVERAPIHGDGTLGSFTTASGATLATPSNGAPLLNFGGQLYFVGAPVERAAIASDGTLGSFGAVSGITLPYASGSAVVVGNWLYTMGGTSGSSYLGNVARASIDGDGLVNTTVTATQSYKSPRSFAGFALVGQSAYVLGGSSGGSFGGLASIEQATVAPDGTLGAFATSSATLAQALARSPSAVIGNYVYMFGGLVAASTGTTAIEQAPIQAGGALGAFTKISGTLAATRLSHGVAVVGNYVYALGGFYGSNATSVERAPINADGTLGTFATLSGVSLSTAHTDFSVAVLGNYLYVLGGQNAAESAALTTIDRVALNSDGTLNGNFTASNSFVNARSSPVMAIVGGYLYAIAGDVYGAGNTVERALINADGTLGTFALVSGSTAPGSGYFGFTAGNTTSLCHGSACVQMSLP